MPNESRLTATVHNVHGAARLHGARDESQLDVRATAVATAKHDGANQQRHGAAQQAALEQRGRTTWSDTPIQLAPLVRCYIGCPVVTGDMATAVTNFGNRLMDFQ